MGGETVALQATADKVYYTGIDLVRVLENMWSSNMLADNRPNSNSRFDNLTDNYCVVTGLLVDFTPSWMLWTRYIDNDTVPHQTIDTYAGTEQCTVARGVGDNWFYYMEAYQWKENEPIENTDIILRVQKIGNNLLINIENFDPIADRLVAQPIDVYWGSTRIFNGSVRSPYQQGTIVGFSPRVPLLHPTVGDTYQENGNTTQLTASFNVRDPRGAARYSSTDNIG
jgi:hypothetical protein